MVKVGDVKDMEGKERHPANPVDECGHITRMQTCHLKSRLKIVVYAVCRKEHSQQTVDMFQPILLPRFNMFKLFQSIYLSSEPTVNQGKDSISA